MKSINRTVLLLAVLASSMLSACGVESIGTGHRGVKTVWGEVQVKEGSLPEGLYFYNPLSTSIHEMDTRTLVLKNETNTYTRDVQQANITYVAQYNLAQDKAHLMYRDVGMDWENKLLVPIVEGALKQVVGQWDAVDLVGNRQKATQAAFNAIHDALKEKNINLTSLELVNIQYDKGFEQAVEKKVTAIQRAIEEQNHTKQIEEQAKQKVINAEAEAKSMSIRAQALEKNKNLVQYEWVQKWDGHTPSIVLGTGSNVLMQMPKVGE